MIGGMAMLLHWFNRATEDIVLLVDKVRANIALLKKGTLDNDIEEYGVVRVADEVCV